ncbi:MULTISPECIES: Sec-independent protein translocase subunit TatA [Glutamicibacter]|jgi:sec-independent protein translocase protein TatA|uniref:Sec-independent protein translocase protein TatA n=2 Tax=Glutamicibacter TaxID=1742989 RepID=A0A5B8ITI0_9MICC|nr:MULTISPECIES: Sec-independent protein translocase subunit TatA [Glutamicibacter]ALG29002.1 preprotein translocase [Glutamicibacter halophytocola]MBF6671707.1 Sec-independent protein translocase subunit TatA [Glutamicibacter sp. FBE19]NQD40138.1 Sec-independent protein translocase subunit TatA [Glutamicibacter halophytocola]QDY65260.1 Sec-independent protein translocase subunit TatA [Glutamicibacter halophytocola]TFH57200.1 Sec-independent protein translocase subunit TatA [Glutamicibacter ar
MGGLQGWHLVIIIVLALLLFGAPKLPGLARSMGQSLRIFKSEVRQMKDDDPKSETVDGTVNEQNPNEKNNS